MEFCWFLHTVTFVVQFLGLFLGCDGVFGRSGIRVAAFFFKKWHISLQLLLKSVSHSTN